uniref:Uncharacterized protein n=1 Tax=Tanacetum cinerariifolium TaxID=118510 RepID=A0A6L2N8Q1_TANCI|nr:hypothetical protein [Tanacetum cinerariifolium]
MGNVKKYVAERTRHIRQYDIRVNKRQMQTHASKVDSSKALDVDLVVMESNRTEAGKQDTSSISWNYLTHVVDVDIRAVNDLMPFADLWIPIGKMFTDCTTKADSERPNGSNEDISNPYECDQTLNVSAGTLNLSADLVAVAAPRVVDPAGLPSSTTIDQDVPSANPSSEETTLQGFIPSNLHHLNQSFDTLTKLTKNHSLENVIGDPSRPVSTRSQLQEHAIWCYFDANDNLIPFDGSG